MTEDEKREALEEFLLWSKDKIELDPDQVWLAAIEWDRSREKWEPCQGPGAGANFIRQPGDSVYTKDDGQWYRFKLPDLSPKETQVSDKEKP